MNRPLLQIQNLKLQPYREVWDLQRELQQKLIAGSDDAEETLILCEHPPVITHGKSADPANLYLNRDELEQKGIEVLQIERGGDFTFHGPGQLVAYPIIDLRTKKRDVGWYLRTLEEVVIQTLQEFDLNAVRKENCTGVWIANGDEAPTQKICSMGVRLSRWCTMHGVAINLRDSTLEGFSFIKPCGLSCVDTVSMESLGSLPERSEVERSFTDHFCAQFDYTSKA